MPERRFPPPWSVAEGAPLSEVGRFNASSTIPVHGAGPWVIVETPTRHHTRRRGRPIPRRLLLGWFERVRIRQRLRAHICAGSGRTPGATPKKQRRHHARNSTRVFPPTSTSKEEPGRCAAAKLLTRDEARHIAQKRRGFPGAGSQAVAAGFRHAMSTPRIPSLRSEEKVSATSTHAEIPIANLIGGT